MYKSLLVIVVGMSVGALVPVAGAQGSQPTQVCLKAWTDESYCCTEVSDPGCLCNGFNQCTGYYTSERVSFISNVVGCPGLPASCTKALLYANTPCCYIHECANLLSPEDHFCLGQDNCIYWNSWVYRDKFVISSPAESCSTQWPM